jgi:phenylpyruvate tautomerase PptA (4-oxalocrotonate tautomerase family)
MAEELTTLALQVERLPDTASVRSTCWLYMHEYPVASVYHGGVPSVSNVISLEVNVFEGGLDNMAKQLLIKHFTACIQKHAQIRPDGFAPVYIIIRDVPETNWGVFGTTITLKDLHQPPITNRPAGSILS